MRIKTNVLRSARIHAIEIRNRCSDFNSYRAARVKSLFNAESGCNFDLDAELDLSGEWSIGVVVGPPGSGKTSIGRQSFGLRKQAVPRDRCSAR